MKKLLTFLTLLTLFFGVGWAETATLTFEPTSKVASGYDSYMTVDGTLLGNPTGVTCSCISTYTQANSTYNQLTSGKTMTLTISGFTSSHKLTGIALDYHSNKSSGAGKVTATLGQTSVASDLSLPKVSSDGLNTRTGTMTVTETIFNGSDLVITVQASANSIFVEKFYITYEENGTTPTSYSVNLNQTTGGTISASPTTAAEGATVTLTATPNPGYEFTSWEVLDGDANEVTVTNNQFAMPASDVEVEATFTEASSGGSGRMTFVQTSSSEGTLTNAPNGVTATFSNTYTSNKEQITSGNTMTLTISGMPSRFKITGITLNVHNNKSSGYGTADVTMNGQNIGSLTITGLGNSYSEQDVNITECPFTGDLVITLSCTTNSVFCNAFYIDYEEIPAKTYDVTVTQPTEGGTITASPVGEKVVDAGDKITVTATASPGYELTGWTITGANESAPDANNQITATGNVTITASFSKVELAINRVITTNGENNTAGGWLGAWEGCSTVGEATDATGYTVKAKVGSTITFKAGTNNTYQILTSNVTAVDGENSPVTLNVVSSDGTGTVFSFTMPGTPVTITANFTNYRGTIRLAGRFNGNTGWRTGTSGPAFSYDSANDKYTIDAYFTGEGDGNYFFITYDGNASYPTANGNWGVTNTTGTPVDLSWDGEGHNFAIDNGVYTIELAGNLSTIAFTKKNQTITFSPGAGEVEQGTAVSATSTLTDMIAAIKTTDTGAAGEVTVGVNTDNGNTWNPSETLSTVGSATVYGKAYIGNISATGTANYTVVAANTSTQYQLITSTDDLIAGKKYIIVSTGSYTASGTTYNFTKAAGALSGDLLSDVDVTIDENDIIDLASTSGVTEFKLGGSTNAWTFAFSDGLLLTSATSKKMSASEDGTPATISFSGDEAIINMGSVGNLQYNPNSGNGRFTTYTSDQKPVMLFKQVEGTVIQKSAAPVITPEGGNIVGYSQEVEITQANGGTIYYTTDGTTPTETSTQYDGKFWAEVSNLGDEVTITAVAKEEGKELSNPVSVTYKFVAPVAPVFTPAGGTYTTAQEVSISSTTEGADVYYTTTAGLSAAQIVAQGTKFTTAINVSEETTYYAVTVYHDAHANRDALSSVRQAQYKFSEVESEGLPYTHPFTGGTGFGKFTTEEGDPDITVWTVTDDFGARGTSYINSINYTVGDSWLISPYINLTDAVEPVLTFKHSISKYFIVPNEQATVWIRTYGGEWTQLTTNLPANSNGLSGYTHYSEEYDLSTYNNQLIQVGFKYVNPYQNKGGGIWEIQDFSVVDMNQPIIEVNNIAEFMDNEKVPADRKAKILNPVVVLYHYQQYHNNTEGDYVNDYIWVKDESGYAIIYGKYLDVNYTNGDVIPGGFTATKFYYNVGRFYQMYYPEGLQPATEKALADPEAVTLSILNSNKENYNGHYVTIPKMRIKFSSGELVPYEYNFTTEESSGGQRNFEIGDATLSISSNNKSIIGYNNFDNPWLETLGYPEYENTTSDYGDYNITGIFERYNGVWEFMPIIITPWEENKVTLHDLCQDGVVNEEYTISNPLQVVYVDNDRHSVWVKDDNGQSIWSTSPAANDKNFAIEYSGNTRDNQAYYDQSNWCQLVFDGEIPTALAKCPIINGGKISGMFTNKLNPTLGSVELGDDFVMTESSSYATNYYVARNFAANSDGYFFMNPKPQEYADIVWAIYDSSNKTMIMTSNPKQNPNGFKGSFKVDMSMNINPSLQLVDGTQTGKGYEHFKAIVRLASTSNAPMLKDRMPANTEYVVFPLDITQDVPTGITDVNGKAVKSVKYVNVAGVMSDVPFEGVNIVVTEYTDGSRSTSKMIKR